MGTRKHILLFYYVCWMVTRQHLFYAPPTVEPSPLPHFPVSLTLQPAHSTLASVRSCEAKSFHTTHIYKLLLYYVILKDNTLSNQDMVFEFRSSSGKLWS